MLTWISLARLWRRWGVSPVCQRDPVPCRTESSETGRSFPTWTLRRWTAHCYRSIRPVESDPGRMRRADCAFQDPPLSPAIRTVLNIQLRDPWNKDYCKCSALLVYSLSWWVSASSALRRLLWRCPGAPACPRPRRSIAGAWTTSRRTACTSPPPLAKTKSKENRTFECVRARVAYRKRLTC